VHAEWTKLRTVRGWLIGLFLVIVVTDLLGIFGGGFSDVACITGPGTQPQTGAACTPGPDRASRSTSTGNSRVSLAP